MADAFAFAVSRPRFGGVDGAHAPFGALFSALNALSASKQTKGAVEKRTSPAQAP